MMPMSIFLFTHSLLLISNFIGTTEAYGSGAPRLDSVCRNKIPGHHTPPQTTWPPYKITVMANPQTGNDVINITIQSEDYFRGIFLQIYSARNSDDIFQAQVVSEFFPMTETRQLSCFRSHDTLTHAGRNKKQKLEVIAKIVSPELVDHFIANATIVREFSEYWTNVTSKVHAYRGKTKKSLPWKWLKLTAKAAKKMKKSKEDWSANIKERFQGGWGSFIQDGVFQSQQIKKSLPFTLHENNDDEKEGVSFENDKNKKFDDRETMKPRELVTEFLKGNLGFADDVERIINV